MINITCSQSQLTKVIKKLLVDFKDIKLASITFFVSMLLGAIGYGISKGINTEPAVAGLVKESKHAGFDSSLEQGESHSATLERRLHWLRSLEYEERMTPFVIKVPKATLKPSVVKALKKKSLISKKTTKKRVAKKRVAKKSSKKKVIKKRISKKRVQKRISKAKKKKLIKPIRKKKLVKRSTSQKKKSVKPSRKKRTSPKVPAEKRKVVKPRKTKDQSDKYKPLEKSLGVNLVK